MEEYSLPFLTSVGLVVVLLFSILSCPQQYPFFIPLPLALSFCPHLHTISFYFSSCIFLDFINLFRFQIIGNLRNDRAKFLNCGSFFPFTILLGQLFP